jgi:hypothetical protein
VHQSTIATLLITVSPCSIKKILISVGAAAPMAVYHAVGKREHGFGNLSEPADVFKERTLRRN